MSAGGGSLPRYIGQRALLIIPMIWVLLTMVFILLRVAPGDPVTAAVGGKLNEEALDELASSIAARMSSSLSRPLLRAVASTPIPSLFVSTSLSPGRAPAL